MAVAADWIGIRREIPPRTAAMYRVCDAAVNWRVLTAVCDLLAARQLKEGQTLEEM
jgi:hypothetical protein